MTIKNAFEPPHTFQLYAGQVPTWSLTSACIVGTMLPMQDRESPQTQSDESQKLPRKRPSLPLVTRMYLYDHFVELVRLFGYNEIPYEKAREQVKPLIEKYGKEVIADAADEIVYIDNSRSPAVARLNDHARKLAVQLLGRPPEPPPPATAEPVPSKVDRPTGSDECRQDVTDGVPNDTEPSDDSPQSAANPPHDESRRVKKQRQRADTKPASAPCGTAESLGKPVRRPREEVIVDFREWLAETKQAFVPVDEHMQMEMSDGQLGTLDFILYTEPRNRLVTVRRKPARPHVEEMQGWERRFGPDFEAYSVWPFTGPDGCAWVYTQILGD